MSRPTCEKCRYWQREENSQYLGECRRRAPSNAMWLATRYRDWCGEFESASAHMVFVTKDEYEARFGKIPNESGAS